MEVCVSVLAARNLSQSALITRNLYSILEVGSSVHNSPQLEASDVRFQVPSVDTSLILTVRNGQTQTIMFVRRVPLEFVLGSQEGSQSLWVAVYEPGDTRNLSFDPAPPRPDVPQVHLSLRSTGQTPGAGDRLAFSMPASGHALDRTGDSQISFASPRRSPRSSLASASGTGTLDTLSIREKELQAEDIKAKVAGFQDRQRQGRATKHELEEVSREIKELNTEIDRVDQELRQLSSLKNAAEREEKEARDKVAQAHDMLRKRELSIAELRSHRDESQRQLSRVQQERDHVRSSKESEIRSFEQEVRGMAMELDIWKAESNSVSEKLQRVDKRVAELRARGGGGVPGSPGVRPVRAELRALQEQLEEAQRELEEARREAQDKQGQALDIEDRNQAARAKLLSSEAAVAEAKGRLTAREESHRRRAIEARAEAGVKEKELIHHMGQAAQLEGQVGESRIQVRERQSMVKEAGEQIEVHQKARDSLSGTISELTEYLDRQEKDKNRAVSDTALLEAKVHRAREQLAANRAKSSSLAGKSRELEDTRAREALELDSTRRVQQHMLKAASDEADRHKVDRERLQQAISPLEARLESCSQALDETRRRGDDVLKELEGVRSEKLRRAEEQEKEAKRLAELAEELEAAIMELQKADTEAEEMQCRTQLDATQRVGKVEAMELELERLASELAEQKRAQEEMGIEQESLARSLEMSRALEPIKEDEVANLKSIEQTSRDDRARLEAAVQEARDSLFKQLAAVEKLREGMSEEQKELGSLAHAADEGARKMDQLQQTHATSRVFWSGRREFVQKELEEIEGRTHDTKSHLHRLCADHTRISSEREKVVEACREASLQIQRLQAEIESQRAAQSQSVSDIAAESAKQSLQEADLNRGRQDLEDRLQSLETQIAGDLENLRQVEADLESRRRRTGDHSDSLRTINEELDQTTSQKAATRDRLSELTVREQALKARAAQLGEQHASLQAAASRANRLQGELDVLSSTQQLRRVEHGRRLAALEAEIEGMRGNLMSSAELAGKSTELEGHSSRIEELEREIKDQLHKVEGLRMTTGSLQRQLGAAEAEERQARAEDDDHGGKLAGLQQEISALEEGKQVLEHSLAAAEGRTLEAQEAAAKEEEELRKRDADLAELVSKARDISEECKGRVEAVRAEVAAQERQKESAADDVARLEAEVQAMTGSREDALRRLQEKSGRRERYSKEVEELEQQLKRTAAESLAAQEEVEQQIAMLREQEREADEMGGRLAAEEQKLKLLKEQLAGREGTLERLLAERAELEAMCGELAAELEVVNGEVSSQEHTLDSLVQASEIQFADVHQLEEQIRLADHHQAIILQGLAEADMQTAMLQREHELMLKQLQGNYQGNLHEWAQELLNAKAQGETEKRNEELRHWMQVAETAEQELLKDLEAAKRQHHESERHLQEKLNSLVAQLPQVQRQLDDLSLNQHIPEVSGSVHSVPAPLHGLLDAPPRNAGRRRALVVGCNYHNSHAPLQGCINDAWNLHCLLRHSLGYQEDQVLCFIDGSVHCPSPPSRQPTRANILSGIQWLMVDARPDDSIALFFCGYGTQQPVQSADGLHQAFLVPSDFADDLPGGFLRDPQAVNNGGCAYRLVPLVELAAALSRLPAGCKATLVLDCCHASVPGVDASRPEPSAFPRVARDLELGDLQALQPNLQPRFLDLPPLVSQLSLTQPGALACCCHCYSACQSSQWCAELPIEGCIQGAFTWAFVKALIAGHLNTGVQQHMKAMHAILADLRHHFRWVEQTPLLQLSAAAGARDPVLAA